jgi:hypothetical protein
MSNPAAGTGRGDTAAERVSTGLDLVCTLGGADAMRGRITDWQTVIGRAAAREAVDGGVALRFDHDAALTVELARLAVAEHACCGFFSFSLTVNAEGVRFAVNAPDDARELVAAVFGVPA